MLRRLVPFVCLAVAALPTHALAQDAPPEPYPDPAQPPPPPPPLDPAPAPPPPAAVAPPPPGGYYQPPPQQYAAPDGFAFHRTMTVELNLGIGWIHAQADGDSDTSDLGIGGLSLGVGGWVSPQLAITGRIAGVTLSEDGATLTNAFFGPSIQYWVNKNLWLGGGAGIGVLRAAFEGNSDSTTGFALDLRAGYTFNEGTENTFNVSIELNPGFFSENGESATLTGIGLLFGYQHL